MTETRRRTWIPCFLVRYNWSQNSHQLVVGNVLLGISGSLFQNRVEPNLSTEAT